MFNQFGEVVGVTTAIITAGQNLNLAMPTKYLKPLVLRQPNPMALDQFAKATRAPDDEREHADTDEDTSGSTAQYSKHAVSVLDGCRGRKTSTTPVAAIMSANRDRRARVQQADREGFEECFRIYEGTALRLEASGACKGIRSAFGDGLLRANSLKSYKDKAWAISAMHSTG